MKKEKLFLLFLIILFLFLRLYQLPQRVNFSMDQGNTLLKVYEVWQTKKPTLIGPESSIKSIDKHSFFYAPWIYYFLLPFMLIGNWEPLFGSFLFIGLNLIALTLLYLGIKEKFGFKTAFISGLIFTINPKMISFSQFFWNPNFLPLSSCLLLYLWLKISIKHYYIYFLLTGITIGFGISNHYLFMLTIIPFITWMVIKKRSLKSFFVLLNGIIIGLLPLIIFELKHNFYNLKTIFAILKYGTAENINFPLPFHYFIWIMPFVFLTISLVLEKISKKKRFFTLGAISIFTLCSLNQILAPVQSGYTMPKNWNYLGVKKTAGIIIKENKKNYNVANLLYGDTRAYALRSILIINGKKPMAVHEYPIAESLFVISYEEPEKVIKNPAWEISSFCPCKIEKAWNIEKNINLYLLTKLKSLEK